MIVWGLHLDHGRMTSSVDDGESLNVVDRGSSALIFGSVEPHLGWEHDEGSGDRQVNPSQEEVECEHVLDVNSLLEAKGASDALLSLHQ